MEVPVIPIAGGLGNLTRTDIAKSKVWCATFALLPIIYKSDHGFAPRIAHISNCYPPPFSGTRLMIFSCFPKTNVIVYGCLRGLFNNHLIPRPRSPTEFIVYLFRHRPCVYYITLLYCCCQPILRKNFTSFKVNLF